MTSKDRANMAVSLLEIEYPDARCSLEYIHPYELLIATRLSAQCTDARVNIVTKVLFEKYKTLSSISQANITDVESIVKTCGLYKTKAKDIIAMSKMLISEYNSVLPDTVEELTTLPGIGRKTANLIVGDIYHKPAVVCDTHCIRITNLLGLTISKDAFKVETQLRKCLPTDKSNEFCHRLVLHGRAVCKARSPICENCCLKICCKDYQKKNDAK